MRIKVSAQYNETVCTSLAYTLIFSSRDTDGDSPLGAALKLGLAGVASPIQLHGKTLVPVLADGYVSNLVGYHKIASQFVGPLHGGYAVDLSQNYDQRPRAGAWLPALRVSTQLAVLDLQYPSRDSLLTAKEDCSQVAQRTIFAATASR